VAEVGGLGGHGSLLATLIPFYGRIHAQCVIYILLPSPVNALYLTDETGLQLRDEGPPDHEAVQDGVAREGRGGD
jgi:hypothetical protein